MGQGQHRDTRVLGVENTEAKSELGCISVVEDVFSIYKALGLIPSVGGCTLTCTCVHANMHRNPSPPQIIFKVRGRGKGGYAYDMKAEGKPGEGRATEGQ